MCRWRDKSPQVCFVTYANSAKTARLVCLESQTRRVAVIHSFANEWRLLNRFWAPCSVQMHVLPPLILKCTIYRHSFRNLGSSGKRTRPTLPIVTYRPSHHAAHHPTLFTIITRQTFKKRRCALQRISGNKRVAQNMGTLDSKSQFATSTACACGSTAAKRLSSQSPVPRRAAAPPQPCTPWRLAWYAG